MVVQNYDLDLIEISPKIHLLREGRTRAESTQHLAFAFAFALSNEVSKNNKENKQ